VRDEMGAGAGCNAARTCSRKDWNFFCGEAFGSSYAGAPSSSCPRPPMKRGVFRGPPSRPPCVRPSCGWAPALGPHRHGVGRGLKRRSTHDARAPTARRFSSPSAVAHVCPRAVHDDASRRCPCPLARRRGAAIPGAPRSAPRSPRVRHANPRPRRSASPRACGGGRSKTGRRTLRLSSTKPSI
jgi:hypothetical protein